MGIKKRQAFTLVELTVSMGVLALIVGLTAGVLISVVRSYQRQRVITEIERNGDFVIRNLEENLRGANSITCVEFDGTPIASAVQPIQCNLGSVGGGGRLLAINSLSPKYLGRGSGGTGTCTPNAANPNCYAFLLNSLTQIDSDGTDLEDQTRITNASGANAVNVTKFDVSISGGGTTGVPYNITVTIDINGPGPLWGEEKRTFQSFLTLRGSYN